MKLPTSSFPSWLITWMQIHEVALWGAADLCNFSTPEDSSGQRFPFALSLAIPMNSKIMGSIQQGPNHEYGDEYVRVNNQINELSKKLEIEIKDQGFRAQALAASDRTDTVNIKGDFPHKTAATRSGLGWIGRHCQLITRKYGSWIRLGTVFTDMALTCGRPVERSFCGSCTRCIDECPAGALKGKSWHPGLPREEILDVKACDLWKKEHYFKYHKGHVCGICSAVCPYGLKVLKKQDR